MSWRLGNVIDTDPYRRSFPHLQLSIIICTNVGCKPSPSMDAQPPPQLANVARSTRSPRGMSIIMITKISRMTRPMCFVLTLARFFLSHIKSPQINSETRETVLLIYLVISGSSNTLVPSCCCFLRPHANTSRSTMYHPDCQTAVAAQNRQRPARITSCLDL